MYQSGRAGDEAKKRKSPAKSGRVGIYENGFLKAIIFGMDKVTKSTEIPESN